MRTIAGWLAGVLIAAGTYLSPIQAEEAPAEDEARDVYYGTIGSLNVWMALHETRDGQLAGSYFYDKHREELELSGCTTAEGRFRLEERVDGELTGVIVGARLESERGSGPFTPDDPPEISGTWSSPDGKRRLPLSLWQRGLLGGYRDNDLDSLDPVPVDWKEFRAPDCRIAFRHPRTGPGTWHPASVREENEGEPFPVCRFYAHPPSDPGIHDDRVPLIDIYRGVDRKAVFEKHGFGPFWTTWEVGWPTPDVAQVAIAGRFRVTWAEPPWEFWTEYDGNYVKHHESRLVAVIEDGDSVIYFSSPDGNMRVSHFVRGLLAMEPGQPEPMGAFYTYDSAGRLERQELRSRTHTTWEGTYSFHDEQVYGIEGLPDLHVFVYAHPGRESKLVDLARDQEAYGFLLLREANTHVKGVTPVLEGIDVFPGENEAEIIVRWRHPGQGGLRTVEKYRYNLDGIEAVDRSEFESPGRRMEWCKDTNSDDHSVPAPRAP